MNPLLSLFLIVVFAIAVAFLAASETAVTMSSRVRLHALVKRGDFRATLLLNWQNQMSKFIGTVLLANTCLFSAMTSLIAQILGRFLGDWGIFIASFALGTFITLYLEVLPKVYAYQFPERVALFLSPFILFLQRVLHPITRLIDYLAYGLLKFFRIPVVTPSQTSEDLKEAIDLHTGSRNILNERAMLRSILDLSKVTLYDIMIHRKHVVSFNIDLPKETLVHEIMNGRYTKVPLWQDSPENIIGTINVKILGKTLQEHGIEALNINALVKTPWFVPDTTTLLSQLQSFKENKQHQAFVVDEYGSFLGIVTLEDIVEEIVGEITDEKDIDCPGVRIMSGGEYLVRGDVTLRELQRHYDWDFTDCEASTVAGLVLEHTRSIPHVGDMIIVKHLSIKILKLRHRQIVSVQIIPINT